MKYCISCLSTNLRPNAKFENGICLACKYSIGDQQVDYKIKLKVLQEKIKNSKKGQKIKVHMTALLVSVVVKIVHVKHIG